MYCKCGSLIPEARIEMGYKSCVECSNEERWSCNPLTFHKTGNSIEVIKDRELAEEVAKKAQRRNYGVLKGVTGSYRKYKKTVARKPKMEEQPKEFSKEISRKTVDPSVYDFESVIQASLKMAEDGASLDTLSEYLSNQVQSVRIHPRQKDQILGIINHMF